MILATLALLAFQGPPHPAGVTVCNQEAQGHVYAYDWPNELMLGLAYADQELGYFMLSKSASRTAPGGLCLGGQVARLTQPHQLLTPSKRVARLPYAALVPGQSYYVQAWYHCAGSTHFSDTLRLTLP